MDGSIPLWLFALVVLALALGWWRAATRTRRRNRARQRVARRGEEGAEALLRREGYRIVDRQVTGHFTLSIDGEPRALTCRADLLVVRRGQRFIAEVKTGTRAPDPTLPATRRQLMEYLLAFPVQGVLLVDMSAGQIREVRYPQVVSMSRRVTT